MKKSLFLWLTAVVLAGSPLSAATQECATKAPPRGQNGWTNAGTQCKTEFASCGGLCLCATGFSQNFVTKVTTYTCHCKAPKVRIVSADGLPSCGPKLFELTVEPTIGDRFVAAVLGLPDPEGLSSHNLAGLVASVSLILDNGDVVRAESQPLAGTGFDFGIEIPEAFCDDAVTHYTFTLGQYVQAGSWE